VSDRIDTFSEELTRMLFQAGRKRTFGEEQEIFAGGEKAEFLPIVLSGRVKMLHYLEPGKEVIIGIFEAGEMFAVPPVFDGGVYPATAIAMEESQLLLIERKRFLDLLRKSSELSFAVISWMCSMLRDKTATIQNLATASPDTRVASILLKLSEKEPGDKPVRIKLRRQDIAKMAGLTTETTIRVIRRLADDGLVNIDHGKIIVGDTSGLKRLAES
jgi:CRP/FNR family transcriptional regulator, cyclic AMP receptor protein